MARHAVSIRPALSVRRMALAAVGVLLVPLRVLLDLAAVWFAPLYAGRRLRRRGVASAMLAHRAVIGGHRRGDPGRRGVGPEAARYLAAGDGGAVYAQARRPPRRAAGGRQRAGCRRAELLGVGDTGPGAVAGTAPSPAGPQGHRGHGLRVDVAARPDAGVGVPGDVLRRIAGQLGYQHGWREAAVWTLIAGCLAVVPAIVMGMCLRLANGLGQVPPGSSPAEDKHCEGCGYNLHATPFEQRCPECGRPARESLSPIHRVNAWEVGRAGFFVTAGRSSSTRGSSSPPSASTASSPRPGGSA